MDRSNKIKWIRSGMIAASFLLLFLVAVPLPRFKQPLSRVVLASDGTLLSARIAPDGQWRFAPADSIPYKFVTALKTFEDRWFNFHPGVNPIAVGRALWLNAKHRKVVSGGSTLTMQVARMSRGNGSRSVQAKILETAMAIKTEMVWSKKRILKTYCANAPFGGNVVGLEAASWRYFGKSPFFLSWAESALLAVLPNAPALIYPGSADKQLMAKRNRLLKKLFEQGKIDKTEYSLATTEPLPGKPYPLPDAASHLAASALLHEQSGRFNATLNAAMQWRVSAALLNHYRTILEPLGVSNGGCLVLETATGRVLAYAGNVAGTKDEPWVDVIQGRRSTGSILKPLLYCAALEKGELLPDEMLPDIPLMLSGFNPRNFTNDFDGAVPASEALSRSLNIPWVFELREFGVSRFQTVLADCGITTLDRPGDDYGLSLILGGGEVTLWEMAGVYSSMGRVLLAEPGAKVWHEPVVGLNQKLQGTAGPKWSKGAVWCVFEAMTSLNRPDPQFGWRYFSSSRKVAWKTGTSFGFRDAWAIGVTPDYTVAVWVGNADGEGRAGLTGTMAAAPLMFDVLGQLPVHNGWFTKPIDDMIVQRVCAISGKKAGEYCDSVVEVWTPRNGNRANVCPWHHLVHLDKLQQMQVNANCFSVDEMKHQKWFTLPPVMEWFYRPKHPEYKILPPFAKGCMPDNNANLAFIYPTNGSRIYIPTLADGSREQVVVDIVTGQNVKTVFWYLDDTFIGKTETMHQITISPVKGLHTLTINDQDGNTQAVWFEML